MKATSPLKYDIGWFGQYPNNERSEDGTASRISFFVECMQCHNFADRNLVKCDSQEELEQLFQLYNERLKGLPFDMFQEDYEQLATNTWNDPEYQEARRLRKEEKKNKKTKA